MSVDQARAVARRRWGLVNVRGLEGYDEVLAEDFVHHGPGYDFRGRQAYKDHLGDFYHGYPDARLTVDEVTGNERWVATVCTLVVRQQNPTPWAPHPDGERRVARLVTTHAIADGKIVEEWIVQEWRAAGAEDGIGDPAVSAQGTTAAVERYGELWNSGDPALVDALLSDDVVLRHSDGGETVGRDAFKAGVAHHHETLTGFRVDIDEVVADGDRAAIRFTARGDHSGPFLGSDPSGTRLLWTGMQLLRLRDGRIASIWHQPDDLNLLRQLGRVHEAASVRG